MAHYLIGSFNLLCQQTIAAPLSIQGAGIHLGVPAQVQLLPAAVNTGRRFLYNGIQIPASVQYAVPSHLCTTLRKDQQSLHTPEHLLAALQGLAIDNLIIDLIGPELPILDGSAKGWVEAIMNTGIVQQSQAPKFFQPSSVLFFSHQQRWLKITPAKTQKITVEIDFPHPQIGVKKSTFLLDKTSFIQQLAPARTFGFVNDLAVLQKQGRALGANLQNCLAYLPDKLHPQQNLRFANEVLHHKALDLLGDLALVNRRIMGHIEAYQPGHWLTQKALKQWLDEKEILRYNI